MQKGCRRDCRRGVQGPAATWEAPKPQRQRQLGFDLDLDSDLDLFVLNAPRPGYPSVVFRNDRGTFRQMDPGIRASTSGWPTSSWADWDGDLDPDLLVLDGDGGAIAYRNDRGEFTRGSLGAVPRLRWISATWPDVDGDEGGSPAADEGGGSTTVTVDGSRRHQTIDGFGFSEAFGRGDFDEAELDYVSCSPFRVPIARLAAAQAALGETARDK